MSLASCYIAGELSSYATPGKLRGGGVFGCGLHLTGVGADVSGPPQLGVKPNNRSLAAKTNRNLHPAHLALTPSDAAFTGTRPERG
jgi:hypothetical protein